jgi:imidazolonepropionase-like amidohydrolase
MLVMRGMAQEIALKGITIETVSGGRIENGTIVLKGDRIVAAGASVSVPAGATVVEGKGMVAYPGFIDAYRASGAKLPEPPARGTPPNATTTAPATMWDKNREGIRADLDLAALLDGDALVKDAYANGLTTGVIAAGGGSIRGRMAVAILNAEKTVLVPKWAQEFSFRSSGGAGYPDSLMGVIALLRQTLFDAQGYSGEPKDDVLEALKPATSGLMPSVFYVNTDNEIQRAFRMADEFNLKLMIAGGRDAFRRTDELVKRNVAVLYSTSIGEEPARTGTGDGPPDSVRAERADLWVERADGAKKLAAAGVPMAFSSDGDGPSGYLKNARLLVKRGLDKGVALKAMTLGPAQILGLRDHGSIEAGKVANLAIFDGDFADDKSTVQMVFVNGKVTDLRSKKEGK